MKEKKPTADVRLHVGQPLTLTIRRMGINGEGIGYYKKKTVFVDGALPGEVVRAEVTEVHNTYAKARLVKMEESSPARTTPPCPVYHACGGCSLQHMEYRAQLESKRDLVRESLQKYAGLENPPVRETIGMDDPWGYRNKAQFQVGREGNKLIAGLYQTGSHRLVDLSHCPIQHGEVNQAVQKAKEVLERLEIPHYDERKRTGTVRTIVARTAFQTGELQLTLVTATPHLPKEKELVMELRYALPSLVSISHNINPGKTSLVFGEKTRLLWGKPTIEEQLGELSFDLSARAFFQLNPRQTVKLYDEVKEAAALSGKETVLDLYCGTGTISLWLAPYVREVKGIEIIPEAVEDARRNAERNGITNVSFYVGRAEELLPRWSRQGIHADVVVVDPPRTGLDRSLIDTLLKVLPKRIVYVSCNPSTLAKDLARLLEAYRLEYVQPFDMFPHTAHVESVAVLVRNGK